MNCGRPEYKAQGVRLIDVLLIGPLMVYGAFKGEGMHHAARTGLLLTGLATIVYNGVNWLQIRETRTCR